MFDRLLSTVVEATNGVVVVVGFLLEINMKWIRFLINFFHNNLQLTFHRVGVKVHTGCVEFIKHNGSCAASALEQAFDLEP